MSSAIKAHPGATPHTPPPLRVMLVDDHELVRQGINFLLTSDRGIQIVGGAMLLVVGILLVTGLWESVTASMQTRLVEQFRTVL